MSLKMTNSRLELHLSEASELINHGLVMPYGDIEWVNIGSYNGLLPDGTKPLPEPILNSH